MQKTGSRLLGFIWKCWLERAPKIPWSGILEWYEGETELCVTVGKSITHQEGSTEELFTPD